ncbi:hypothetical protein MFUL124B02_10210 [Myxococcus fulvus 124B02]|nr:hypothetical protein MFUL124B02_10210 [Myxococcus fulvus 124B02]
MEDLLDLIGETAPYARLFGVTSKDDVVLCWFKPEQQRHAETTLMSCSEGMRAMGVMGALVGASANPSKACRHYYLGLHADFRAFPIEATDSEVFQCVGRLEKVRRSKLGPIYQVSGACLTDRGERYAEMEGALLGLTEEEFVNFKGRDTAAPAPWTPDMPSPYVDPVRTLDVQWLEPGRKLRTTLPGFRREDFAGHFGIRPLCPVSMLSANACSLVSHFSGYEKHWISRCTLVCEDVVAAEQEQRLTCVQEDGGRFSVHVESGEGRSLAQFKIDAMRV